MSVQPGAPSLGTQDETTGFCDLFPEGGALVLTLAPGLPTRDTWPGPLPACSRDTFPTAVPWAFHTRKEECVTFYTLRNPAGFSTPIWYGRIKCFNFGLWWKPVLGTAVLLTSHSERLLAVLSRVLAQSLSRGFPKTHSMLGDPGDTRAEPLGTSVCFCYHARLIFLFSFSFFL